MIETLTDLYETKAALLAAKENSRLPVFVSNAYSENGRLLTGAEPKTAVAVLEGMGVDAVGVNCSLGPAALLPVIAEYLKYGSVPVLFKPTAGMPAVMNGKTVYDVSPADFASAMQTALHAGVRVAGGCCGTTPAYLAALHAAAEGLAPNDITQKPYTVVTGYTNAVVFGDSPVLIGERINPTGKKRFQQALRENDIGYILSEAEAQQEKGVHLLDVNVGLPGLDEAALLPAVTRELQAVTDLPLQLDSSDPAALANAMRVYNGKPMLNSVNGKKESMDAIFPLVKKYGGTVVALTLDEKGIPDTAEGRIGIAQKILREAVRYGVDKKDLVFDPLCMAVSADPGAANTVLEALRGIKERLGCKTVLGVSNISFGLPNRGALNGAFFTLAAAAGLGAAIINPFSPDLMKAYYSYCALCGLDENFLRYIENAPAYTAEAAAPAANTASPAPTGSELQKAVITGQKEKAAALTRTLLGSTDGLTLIAEEIIPALNTVGEGFEKKTLFLPQLLMSAEAAKASFEVIKRSLPEQKEPGKGPILLATVKGDIHDIGKNIVKVMLENYGYDVIDLGKDVPPETIVEAAIKDDVKVVGLSALMTTTVVSMEETIKLLRVKKPDTKVVVGGAVMTQEYADQIGADAYSKDAMQTVRYCDEVFGVQS
jgi:5-methyltetrahydrofolate--homocysteine methyltransferase